LKTIKERKKENQQEKIEINNIFKNYIKKEKLKKYKKFEKKTQKNRKFKTLLKTHLK
jgi:hypothetical protein